MIRRSRSAAAFAALLVPLLLAAGCGGDPTPTDQVPGLAARLDAVDQGIAAHDDRATRSAVTRLEHTVYDARQSGDLDQQRADEILSAAEALLTALPGADTSSQDTTTPDTSSQDTTTPSPSSEPSQPPSTESTPAPPAPPPGKEKDKPEKPDKHDEHGHGPKH